MQPSSLDLSPEAENIPGFLLWQVSKLWQRQLNASLKVLKLSSTQAVILGNVMRFTQQGHEVTQIMLSQFTKVDAMTTSTAIRGLERKGLVTRTVPTSNKRAYSVVLTSEGERVAVLVLQRFVQAHTTFFQSLEMEMNSFVGQLQTLKQANDTKESDA